MIASPTWKTRPPDNRHWRAASLAAPVRDTLASSTGGNPLALIEVADSLTDRQRAGRDPLPEILSLSGALQPLFLERIRRRPPEAQTPSCSPPLRAPDTWEW
jgi:hypothetical protein